MTTERQIVISERTSQNTAHFTLKWTIDHFAAYRNDSAGTLYNDGITMTELGFGEPLKGRWKIGVVPCHKVIEKSVEKRFVGIVLKLVDEADGDNYNGPFQLHAEFDVCLTTGESMTIIHQQREAAVFYRQSNFWYNNRFVRQDRLLGSGRRRGLIQDNMITITMDITMYDQANVSRIPELAATSLCQKAFLQRQHRYWQSEHHRDTADFVLRTSDGTGFPVHRFLLAAHSPVFAAMFTHSSLEKQNASCDLTDMDKESVEVLLAYVYACDITEVTVDNAEKVLIMADKYQILDLRGVCENILASNVVAQNAEHYLELANQRKLSVLQYAARKATLQAKVPQSTEEKERVGLFNSLSEYFSAERYIVSIPLSLLFMLVGYLCNRLLSFLLLKK